MANMSITTTYDRSNKQLTLKCTVSGMTANYTGSRQLVYSAGNLSGTLTITSTGTTDTKTIYVSLSPGSTCDYSFDLQWKNKDSKDDWASSVSKSGSYTAEKITVKKWDWYSSNGNATAKQTSNAHSAVQNKGKLSDFSYIVWNDLCAKVKEVVDAAGKTWNTTYANYNSTLMSYSSKILTAKRWNSLRYNVGIHHSTGIYEVNTGDVIYGSYFTKLTNALNAWIDEL